MTKSLETAENDTVQEPVEHSATTVRKDTSKQMVITIAIIGSVVLFFAGLGLGYLLGHNTVSTGQRNFQFPGSFDGQGGSRGNLRQRGYTNNNQNNSSSTTDDQALPGTQTN